MRKRTKKFRGSRTCGGGTHKNRRGAGNRGGRGNVGAGKHHWVRAQKQGQVIGKHGFTSIRQKPNVINLKDLDRFIEGNDGPIEIDLREFGIEKLLGQGMVQEGLTLKVRVKQASKSAISKIESAGGEVLSR